MVKNQTKFNVSFAGCGFLGIYHVGVAACLKQYAPQLLEKNVCGTSAGAITTVCLLSDVPIGQITKAFMDLAARARAKTMGPISPAYSFRQILRDGFEKILPADAHLRVSGRLHLSLTRVYDGKNVIVSKFETREELIQAVLCSSFIPFVSGLMPPKFRGHAHVDGGFTDNCPLVDEHTITVNPFCGEADICPSDGTAQLFHLNPLNTSIEVSRQNLYRCARTLFPPKPEVLNRMCRQGFVDARNFLMRNQLIGCTSCYPTATASTATATAGDNIYGTDTDTEADTDSSEVSSSDSDSDSDSDSAQVKESGSEFIRMTDACHNCEARSQEALLDDLPDTVTSIFEDAIESEAKGLNWLFSKSSVRFISLITLPLVAPIDLAYATSKKLYKTILC